MNREILFRAKAINRDPDREYKTNYKNGDWVYGFVSTIDGGCNGAAEMNNTVGVRGIDVDRETIGEYTGLTDKNGTKIFDGDIVRIGRYFNNNFYTEDNYVCKYDTHTASFKFYYIVPKDIADVNRYAIIGDGATLSDMGRGFAVENVVSNIYDNSDLIEK